MKNFAKYSYNMIQSIASLDKFTDYCVSLIDENQEEDTFELWLMSLVLDDISLEVYIEDLCKTFNEYYRFLAEAVQNELYNMATFIKKASDIEKDFSIRLLNEHYSAKGNQIMNKIIKELKEKYNI